MSEYKINDTETTNNLETYAKGFQDGWNLAMKQSREVMKDFTEVTSGATGAIGAAYLNMTSPGANGPTGRDTK